MSTVPSPKEGVAANPTENPAELLGQISLACSDCHALVSLLYHNRGPGIHYIICQRLQQLNINCVLPQLIQTMLACSPHSMPIYSLLVAKARYSCSFQTRLFIALKSMLGKTDESKASTCYFLCCDIFSIAKNTLNRNLAVLAINHHTARKRSAGLLKRRLDVPVIGTSDDAVDGGGNRMDSRADAQSSDPPSGTWDDSSPIPDTTLGRLLAGESMDAKGTLDEHAAPIAAPAYRKHLFPRKKRPLLRTSSLIPYRTKMPSFPGLVLSFARAVSCLVNTTLFRSLNNISRIFNTKKNFKNLSISRQTPSPFKRTVAYYEALTSLSARLKKQPLALRQRSLEVEIEFFNLTLTGPFVNPFDPYTSIVSLVSEECIILDSADNVPYLVVAEVIGSRVQPHGSHFCGRLSVQAHKASVLQSHLNAVNELSDIGDINGIRENILEALELILFGKNEPKSTPAKEVRGFGELRDHEFEIRQNIKNEAKDTKHSMSKGHPDRTKSILSKVGADGTDRFMKNSKRSWYATKKRIEAASPYASYPGWSLLSFIVKSGASLRQEYLAYQILTQMKGIFSLERVDCYLNNYKIYLVSETSGLIETVTDALSIHKIKSSSQTLQGYFDSVFKDPSPARKNFLSSLVGYSLASFLLQIKDRHNGNILIDAAGHIIHVDFGFVLGGHPGFYCVESAPFKFSAEYLDLVDLDEFKALFYRGFSALRVHSSEVIRIVEIMEGGGLCYPGTVAALSCRFNLSASEREFEDYCGMLVDRSINNMRTTVYDKFQYFSNGYY